jgi:hypothetical protein
MLLGLFTEVPKPSPCQDLDELDEERTLLSSSRAFNGMA